MAPALIRVRVDVAVVARDVAARRYFDEECRDPGLPSGHMEELRTAVAVVHPIVRGDRRFLLRARCEPVAEPCNGRVLSLRRSAQALLLANFHKPTIILLHRNSSIEK